MKKSEDSVAAMLVERASTHGGLMKQGAISQDLKYRMRLCPAWLSLDSDMREALEMVQHKIARILAGNSKHIDHWDDICGYARLVADRLKKDGAE